MANPRWHKRADEWQPVSHDEAIEDISAAHRVAHLSIEEVVLIYCRARGFLRDDAKMMASEPPADWRLALQDGEGR